MRLVRFMSTDEMQKYLSGEVLHNDMPWRILNKSTSKGFCFFGADPAPEERLHYVSGVVSFDVVAEFETVGPINIRKGVGRYRDPEQDSPKSLAEAVFTAPKMMEVPEYSLTKMMEVPEYSLTEYSKSVLRLIRMGTVVMNPQFDWEILWGKGRNG